MAVYETTYLNLYGPGYASTAFSHCLEGLGSGSIQKPMKSLVLDQP